MHILKPEYHSGKWVIFFIGLGCLMDMATGANSSIMGTSRYYKIQSYLLLILVVILIAFNLILIPLYGITGAAISSAAALGFLNLFRFLFLYFKFGLQPYNSRFFSVILLGAAAYFLARVIPVHFHYIIDILIRSSVFTALFLLPVYFLGISSDLNKTADNLLRSLKIIR